MLTETDFLRRLKAGTFLELMLRLIADAGQFSHRCHDTQVREVMTTPAQVVGDAAGFREIMASFARHPGRGMPVVDHQGRCIGMLLRKDFFGALNRRL